VPVLLPALPAPARLSVSLISARREIRPVFGGPVQRFARLGSRYAAQVRMPAMTAAEAMAWRALEEEVDTVRLTLPQPRYDVGSPGSVTVAGAGQAGSALTVAGLVDGYEIKAGQWLSLSAGGRLYLHAAAADVTAQAGVDDTIPIRPALRVSPPAGGVVDIAAPQIEGFATLGGNGLEIDASGLVRALTFTITEVV